ASLACDKLGNDRRQFCSAKRGRLYTGGVQKRGEHVEALFFHRISNQYLIFKLLRFYIPILRKRVGCRHGQHQLVAKKWQIANRLEFLWVRGNDDIEVAAYQGRQGGE